MDNLANSTFSPSNKLRLGYRHAERLGNQAATRTALSTAKAARFGRNLKGLGLLAGGLGMLDLAVTIGMSLGSPGAARDISMAQVLNGDESYLDSRQAYTQRQNALRAISESSLGAGRAILGQEASFIHSR
jgi:hypothetical protein